MLRPTRAAAAVERTTASTTPSDAARRCGQALPRRARPREARSEARARAVPRGVARRAAVRRGAPPRGARGRRRSATRRVRSGCSTAPLAELELAAGQRARSSMCPMASTSRSSVALLAATASAVAVAHRLAPRHPRRALRSSDVASRFEGHRARVALPRVLARRRVDRIGRRRSIAARVGRDDGRAACASFAEFSRRRSTLSRVARARATRRRARRRRVRRRLARRVGRVVVRGGAARRRGPGAVRRRVRRRAANQAPATERGAPRRRRPRRQGAPLRSPCRARAPPARAGRSRPP